MQRVKYDKIQHVRHAVGRALAQLAAAGPAGPDAAVLSPKPQPARGASAASSGATSTSSVTASAENRPPAETAIRLPRCALSPKPACRTKVAPSLLPPFGRVGVVCYPSCVSGCAPSVLLSACPALQGAPRGVSALGFRV